MWECFVGQRSLKGFSLLIFCKPQILLAWWNIPLQQSQRAKKQTPTKPRVISNYRWWKEEVKKVISSKCTTFNKFSPNQFLKAMVWNEKKWSEIEYDSRKNRSNFFVKKWQKYEEKKRSIHCKQKRNQNWKSLKALKRHWPFYIYVCLNYTQNILWQPSQFITLMFLSIHCVPTCFVTTFSLFQSNSHQIHL